DGIEDVIGGGTGTEALETVDNFKPDIVFLDFHLPDQFGDEVAKQLKIKFPKLHIIIFTGIDVTELYNHFLDLQVSGIVSKESDVETIRDVIRGIRNNHAIVPLELFHKMRVLSKHQSPERALTEEEHDIMTMVVGGFTNEYIAEK